MQKILKRHKASKKKKINTEPMEDDFLSLGGKYKVKNPIPAERIRDYINYAEGRY